MTVRRLKAKQRGPVCSYCESKAEYRGFGFGKFACEQHVPELTAWDRREQAPDYSDAAFVGGFGHD